MRVGEGRIASNLSLLGRYALGYYVVHILFVLGFDVTP